MRNRVNDAANFYEKHTEIHYTREIRDRFRMAVSVCEKVLLHGGLDMGTVYAMSPVLVVASSTLANHDALGASVLVSLQNQVPRSGGGMDYNAAFAPVVPVRVARDWPQDAQLEIAGGAGKRRRP